MKKHFWVMALVLSALFTGALAAETSHASQDQAFFAQLAQPSCDATVAATAPLAAGRDGVVTPPVKPLLCAGSYCTKDTDCYAACPGGAGSSYCDRTTHRCYPF